MSRPIQAIVHHSALKHNLDIVRQSAPNSQVFAVVKANAYGHGIENVYEALKDADGFALLDIAEAKRLRALGWEGPILLLEGIFSPKDLFDCAEYQLSFSVHSEEQLTWLLQFNYPAQFEVFLKMNSGMNRLGFKPEQYPDIWKKIIELNTVKKVIHMTHFSDADGERYGKQGIDYQYEIFEKIVKDLSGEWSISNSAAILRYSTQLKSDYVRSGIMLYGSSPDYPIHTIQDWQLQPTMSLKSELISIQTVECGESVGYGSKFVAEKPLKIGIVACGYADGYQRISATDTPILVDGVLTHIVGRVSMDMLAVDLTPIPHAAIGSEVVLWGKSKTGKILPIDDVATTSNTIGYELMCGVTARVTFKVES